VSRGPESRPETAAFSWESIDRRLAGVKNEEELSALQAFADPDVVDLSNSGAAFIPDISEEVFFGTGSSDALDFENGLDTLTPQEKKDLVEALQREVG
jgi:hypothetical protein